MANVALSRIFLRKLLLIAPLWLVARSVGALSFPRGGGDGKSFPPRPGRTDWDGGPSSPLQEYDTSDSDYHPEDSSSMFSTGQQNDGSLDDEIDSLKGFDDDDESIEEEIILSITY